ncbi:MAG: SDR family NAD(P)-dependent oxidoreductase [Opitutales bacterium]
MSDTVLITGVSSGLGYGLAKVFLERGARVYGCSRREPEDLVARGMVFTSVNLANEAEGKRALKKLLAGAPALDLVVLNAGKLGRIRDMKDTPLDDLRDTMEINVWANKWLLDVLYEEAPGVKQVVGISSGASQSGSRGWNGYSISKAALNMLIKLYADERSETHFTALAPGLVDTAMQDYLTALPADERYPPLQKLKAAKGTDAMPDGETCARRLLAVFPRLLEHPSGAYVDIRKM